VLDGNQPVYLLELGAGAGRFAYYFLRQLVPLWRQSVLRDVPVKYVLTDYNEKPLEFWQTHSRLRPYVDAGVLDFACFDVERDKEIRLRASGAVHTSGVVPTRAEPRPRCSLAPTPVSSPQWISAPSRAARASMAG
jgi:hypothetical protein